MKSSFIGAYVERDNVKVFATKTVGHVREEDIAQHKASCGLPIPNVGQLRLLDGALTHPPLFRILVWKVTQRRGRVKVRRSRVEGHKVNAITCVLVGVAPHFARL